MKKFILSLLILSAFSAFAEKQTNMNANWICTTNASSSKNQSAKAADDLMAKTTGNAVDSFVFAAKNCRNCTKITCKTK
jgi:hypothetical protein